MSSAPQVLVEYHYSRKPLVRGLSVQPWRCEFWRIENVAQYNANYEVNEYASGYFGFGSNGGGEMFAISTGW